MGGGVTHVMRAALEVALERLRTIGEAILLPNQIPGEWGPIREAHIGLGERDPPFVRRIVLPRREVLQDGRLVTDHDEAVITPPGDEEAELTLVAVRLAETAEVQTTTRA